MMVLWILVLLTVITAVLAQTSRLDTKISAVTSDRLRCKWACRAGMELIIGILNDDDAASDSFGDLWTNNPQELEQVELEGCVFSVEAIDEASKLDINIATKDMLMILPDMTEDIAYSILDWRDKNDTAKPGSAEGGYYMNLPYPYQIKNKPFSTIRELLRVKGVTEELFFGPRSEVEFSQTADNNIIVNEGWINYLTCYCLEKNKDSEGNNRLKINSASEKQLIRKLQLRQSYAKWIVENRKKGFKSIGDLLSSSSPAKPNAATEKTKNAAPLDVQTVLEIADKICITDKATVRGKINLNTASKVVLMALFSGKEDIVNDVIAYRQTQIYGIESLEQLAEISSLKKDVLKKTLDLICLRSEIFTIKSLATANLTNSTLYTEAVIDRTTSPVQIVYFCQGAKF